MLSTSLKSDTFKSYYYLKEELVKFCKEVGLQCTGGKQELTERIAYFLVTGKKLSCINTKKPKVDIGDITLETIIEENFVCSEKHRRFFKSIIGAKFSFNVEFQKWLKESCGKNYADAINKYYNIIDEKKNKTTIIDGQFEYNTYIRAFFNNNKGRSLEDAIRCWKYKKAIQGHNKYEKEDLLILEGLE